jgi:hypothetical protein
VLSIQPPETITASLEDFENVNAAELISLPLEAARGKWFDKAQVLGLPTYGKSQKTYLCMSKFCGDRAWLIYKPARRWRYA